MLTGIAGDAGDAAGHPFYVVPKDPEEDMGASVYVTSSAAPVMVEVQMAEEASMPPAVQRGSTAPPSSSKAPNSVLNTKVVSPVVAQSPRGSFGEDYRAVMPDRNFALEQCTCHFSMSGRERTCHCNLPLTYISVIMLGIYVYSMVIKC